MATSSAMNTTNQYIKYTISITQNSQSTANNTSNVTVKVRFYRTNTGYTTYGTGTVYCKINGTKYSASVGSSDKITADGIHLFSKTLDISHDSDGTKTLTCSAWIDHSQFSSSEQSYKQTLSTIPRASTITSATDVNLGSKTKIVWTPMSKSFYYKVKLTLGSWSWTSAALQPNITSAYTYTTSSAIPYTVAKQFSKTEKSGTMTATLYTYSDSGCTKQIGSADTETFKVTLPDNSDTKPDFNMSLAPVNTSGVAWGSLYVQGVSKVKATLSSIEPKYGAEISTSKITVDGKPYTSPYQSNTLSVDGERTVTGSVKDTRGFTRNVTKNITVIPYGKPRILPHSGEQEIICVRCDEDGTPSDSGRWLLIKARRSYSKIMSGNTQHNFCGFYYRWKHADANYTDTDDEWKEILGKTNTDTDDVYAVLPDICTDTTTSYDIELKAEDDVGKSAKEPYRISTKNVDFNLKRGGGGAAFGKYSEENNTLEIAADWSIKVCGDRWVDLGISSSVSTPNYDYGRVPPGKCCYRVENGNHVYVAANVKFDYKGEALSIGGAKIPSEYCPRTTVFASCPCNGKVNARFAVAPSGTVYVSFVQDLVSSTETTSKSVLWFDGYIDYFI